MFKAICSTNTSAAFDADASAELVMPVSFAVPERPHRSDANADAWHRRVDMMLADAEHLVEGLRSLIAAADGLQDQAAARPTALALAGMKIGAESTVAPPRFSAAQLEALSRLPVRRGLNIGADGRVLHSLNTPARVQQKSASTSRD